MILPNWNKLWNSLRGSVARAGEVAVGGHKTFAHPADGAPCILIRTAADSWVAYRQSCTHRACTVAYSREGGRLECPCHGGVFSVETGAVVAGPPQRPLPRVEVERRGGLIFAARTK